MIYLDTSSLVALYFADRHTARVQAHLREQRLALPLTWLHEVELTNGLHLKLFRSEARETQVAATLAAFRDDIEAGVFVRTAVEWPRVFEAALRLASVHSRHIGTRTLDLLHVAAGSALPVKEFVTSDKRQAKTAELAGMTVRLIL